MKKNIKEQQEFKSKVVRYPGDKNWQYKVVGDNWYAQKIGWPQDKWVNLSANPKYKASVEKLDKQFPKLRTYQVSGIPLKNTPSYADENPDKVSFKPQTGWSAEGDMNEASKKSQEDKENKEKVTSSMPKHRQLIKMLSFRIVPAYYKEIEKVANHKKMTVSKLIRSYIKEGMKRDKELTSSEESNFRVE